MIPSAYKDGKLYSIRPTDGDGDFTFSRGSNLAATRVDVNGLIEKGRENLLTYSNTFSDTDWTKTSVSVTGGQSGYDGSNDASLIEVLTSGAPRKIAHNQTTASGVLTMSVYAKAGTAPIIAVEAAGSNGFYKYFNLSTGTGGSQGGSIIDSSMVDVGGGWYRLSITGNPTSISSPQYFVCDVDNSTTAAAGSNIYIQDAQLEQGLVATDVITTTTTSVSAGILEDMPRLDYSGGASCPSLLLEPQRRNNNSDSEYFGAWSATATITANAGISPEGVQNAYNIASNSGVGNGITKIMGVLSSTQYVCSIYVKSAGATTGKIRLFDGTSGGSTTTTFTPTSEWQRVEVTRTSGSTTFQFRVDIHSNDGDLLIYGAQLEAGSYPTSYIPTYGSSVTRSYDSCTATSVSDLIGQTQGTLFVDVTLSNVLDSNLRGLIELNDGTTDNRFSIYRGGNTLDVTALVFKSGAATASALSSSTGQTKIIIAYDETSVRFYFNGVLVGTTNSASIPACNQIDLGIITNRADRVLGDVINQALVFPTALTDSECIALTE